jgi:hypothetical protein
MSFRMSLGVSGGGASNNSEFCIDRKISLLVNLGNYQPRTAEGRYFDIVYDSKELAWFCVLEIEEGFLAVEG